MPNHGMTPHYSGTTLDAQVQPFSLTPVVHAVGDVVDFTMFDPSKVCTRICFASLVTRLNVSSLKSTGIQLRMALHCLANAGNTDTRVDTC